MVHESVDTTLTGCAPPSARCGSPTPLDQRRMRSTSSCAHPGGGLVEQQHLGIERERGGELQRALAAVGELDGGWSANVGEARPRRAARGRGRRAVEHRSERQKSNEWPCLRCSATRTFSSTVRCGNTAEIWNERTRPEPGDRRAGATPVISPAVVDDAAARGREEVREQVEAGGLAGPVRADQRVDGAAADAEVDAVDGDEALELLA